MPEQHRHILALSGGKDSTALALFMRKAEPWLHMEYVFADTGRELPEVYQFLDVLEKKLAAPIHRITDYGRRFDDYLERWNWFLPGNASRWCTKHLKIRPFERFAGTKIRGRFIRNATIYIALRADELEREGNYGIDGVTYRYPFREYGVDLDMVKHFLNAAGIELPFYYKWRATGGCWMCPWQRRSDWIGLKKWHPELFEQACQEEEKAKATWSVTRIPLRELTAQTDAFEDEDWGEVADERPCLICAK